MDELEQGPATDLDRGQAEQARERLVDPPEDAVVPCEREKVDLGCPAYRHAGVLRGLRTGAHRKRFLAYSVSSVAATTACSNRIVHSGNSRAGI